MQSKIQQKIEEALGHTSAIFMSQECKGTEIVMPTEQLIKISEQLAQEIVDMVVEEINTQKTNEVFLKSVNDQTIDKIINTLQK